jgi:outer membrane protein assembly factor BamD
MHPDKARRFFSRPLLHCGRVIYLPPLPWAVGLGHATATGKGTARSRAPYRFVRTDIMTHRSLFFGWLARSGATLVLIVLLGACAEDAEVAYRERSVDALYNEAMDLVYARKYKEAALTFDEVERQHPYSVWATRAQLMSAYSYYRNDQYDEAVIAARRFIQLHPGHADVAYAYYLIGIGYYEQISDIGRDQGITRKALDAFEDLVRRFPESEYAEDARQKIVFSYDHLAGKEIEIGRYYLIRGYYIAAIGRFRVVIDNFETTSHTPEALHRLVEAYLALGLSEEAHRAAAILGHNFRSSPWYRDSYRLLTGKDVPLDETEDDGFLSGLF